MDYYNLLISFVLIAILIISIILLEYVRSIKKDLKYDKEILFIESSVVTAIDKSDDYITLYSYDNRFNKKRGAKAEFIIKLKNTSAKNFILLKVQDEFGNELGKEVYVTQEIPSTIPFTYKGTEDFFNLLVKTDTEIIELSRIEINFNKRYKY